MCEEKWHHYSPLRYSSVACDHLRIVAIQSDILELVSEVDHDPVYAVKVHLHLQQHVPQKVRHGEVSMSASTGVMETD